MHIYELSSLKPPNVPCVSRGLGDWPTKEEGFIFYNDFILDAEKLIQPPVLQEGPPKDEDTAIIFWSSGTTGQPKARAALEFGLGGGMGYKTWNYSVNFVSFNRKI